jgi:EAL domain-containing protein (putative c-di-GMP-specific phosphodiesterase class I)
VIDDAAQLGRALNAFRAQGLAISIDDFGAGYAGLNLLADFQPDSVKLDMHLVRGIDGRGPRQAIVRAILQVCVDLGIDVIAEGVETSAEYQWLLEANVRYFQGYLRSPVLNAFRVCSMSKAFDNGAAAAKDVTPMTPVSAPAFS